MAITEHNRKLHTPEIVKAADEGLDPDGGPWVAICTPHGTLMNQPTRNMARTLCTLDFCECCREVCTEGMYGSRCPLCGAQNQAEAAEYGVKVEA